MDSIRNKGFLPVQNVAVSIPHSGCLYCRQIRADIRLRHGNCGDDLPGDTSRKPPRFLFFVAETIDVMNNDITVERNHQTGNSPVIKFLHDNDRILITGCQPTVFLFDPGAEIAVISHLVPHRSGNYFILFPFFIIRNDLAIEIPAKSIPEDSVFFRKRASFHCPIPFHHSLISLHKYKNDL